MTSWPHLLRDIADFPSPGIVFKDITPVLADATGFAAAIADLAAPWRSAGLQAIVGIEARGFILGAALAQALGTGFAPIRKPGKLPAQTLSQAYHLEYGQGHLEMHLDALPARARVLIVDDVLATGGTLAAALTLVQRQGADPIGAAVLVELTALAGRERWSSSLPLVAAQAY